MAEDAHADEPGRVRQVSELIVGVEVPRLAIGSGAAGFLSALVKRRTATSLVGQDHGRALVGEAED
jgi:hypothetical protein